MAPALLRATPVGPNSYFGPYPTVADLQAAFPSAANLGRRAFVGPEDQPAAWATYESVGANWMQIATGGNIVAATTSPPSEGLSGSPGTSSAFARADHSHARLSSSTRVTLDANGQATVVFTRSFTSPPAISVLPIDIAVTPVFVKVMADVKTGPLWTGCTIQGYRGTLLPGSIPLVSSLANYNVFGASAVGVVACVIALPDSSA